MFLSRHIGPVGIAWWRRALAGCLAIGVAAGPAVAQSRLGATDGRGPLPPPASALTLPPGGPALQSGGPAAPIAPGDGEYNERAELTSARLLAVARMDLSEGRPDIAQRVLEQLIARYPDTSVVAEARRELFALYAVDNRIGTAKNGRGQAPIHASGEPFSQPRRQGQTPAPAVAQGNPPTAVAPVAAPPADTGWRTSIVGFRRLQDELRNGVGDRVFFSGGSAELGSRARAVISAQAAWLQQRPDVDIVIEGHADDAMIGGDNEALATVRASVLRDRLVAEGVDIQRIRIVPSGARDPVAVCSDSECAAQNRRAIVQVAVRRSQAGDNNGAVPAGSARAVGVQR